MWLDYVAIVIAQDEALCFGSEAYRPAAQRNPHGFKVSFCSHDIRAQQRKVSDARMLLR